VPSTGLDLTDFFRTMSRIEKQTNSVLDVLSALGAVEVFNKANQMRAAMVPDNYKWTGELRDSVGATAFQQGQTVEFNLGWGPRPNEKGVDIAPFAEEGSGHPPLDGRRSNTHLVERSFEELCRIMADAVPEYAERLFDV